MNIVEALTYEIARNRELLQLYRNIPTGAFGAMMIEQDIDDAEKALASDDIIKITNAYAVLKGNE